MFCPSLAETPAVMRSDVYLPYFAIAARMTAKLKMNPVNDEFG